MDAFDIQKYNNCLEIANRCDIKIDVKDKFRLTDRRGYTLGVVDTVAELYSYLCGYSEGCSVINDD